MKKMLSILGTNLKPGLSVALISVPLAMSLAIVCGATPLMGLLTGAWSGILAAIFCNSRHNVYGPAGSLAGILLPIALTYGIQYLPLVAIIAGIVIMLFAAFKLTKYLTLIPGSALQGFLLGLGLVIGLQQFPAALGIDPTLGFVESLSFLGDFNLIAFGIFAVTFAIMNFTRRVMPQVPGAVVVTVLGVVIGKWVMPAMGFNIDLLLDVYTDVQFSIFQMNDRSAYRSTLRDISLLKVFVVAGVGTGIIAILETLISAKVAAKDTGTRYDPQREVMGLGITNILTGAVGGIPVSALVARTAMNIQNGANSKLSGALVGAFTAIFAVFFFANSLQYLPFAVIAGILVDIALSMINFSLYHKMWKLQKSSILVILLVGGISYIRDPMMGILVGTVMTLLMFVNRTMDTDLMVNVFRNGHHSKKLPLTDYPSIQESNDVLVIKLEGELNYLTIESHITAMKKIQAPKILLLGFGHTATIDTDAQEELDIMIQSWLDTDNKVYIAGLKGQALHMMEHGTTYHVLSDMGHVAESKSALLERLLG